MKKTALISELVSEEPLSRDFSGHRFYINIAYQPIIFPGWQNAGCHGSGKIGNFTPMKTFMPPLCCFLLFFASVEYKQIKKRL